MEKILKGSSLKIDQNARNYILSFNSTEAIQDFLYEKHFVTSVTAKIYKKELFEGIEFPKGKKYEDLYVLYKIVSRCNTVVYGNKPIYYYIIRGNSTIGTLDPLKNKDFLLAAKEVHMYVLNHCYAIRKAADFKLFQAAIEMFVHLPKKVDNHEQKCYKEELWRYIIKYRLQIAMDNNCRFKYRILALVSFFGQTILSSFFQFASRR